MSDTFELYSKRLKKQLEAGQPAVYQYDVLSLEFRRQVVHIWHDTLPYEVSFNVGRTSSTELAWNRIIKIYTDEMGVFSLDDSTPNPFEQCVSFIQTADAQCALDLIDLSFKVIYEFPQVNPYELLSMGVAMPLSPDAAIQKLNRRFQEHKIGYEFIEGSLIRKDSQFIHAEAVEPAIRLLHRMAFQGPSDEFMKAHEHYRHGRYSEAIVEALKAFESTLKIICTKQGWTYAPTDTAGRLIQIVIDNGLVDKSLTNHLTGLRTVMEGLPTIRNKTSGHGAGPISVVIPEYLASYALHLAAANIVFLVEAYCGLNSH